MAFGIQTFNEIGLLVWDSTTALGGVVADYQEYAASSSGVLVYPSFAGRTAFVVPVLDLVTGTVSVDSLLGYPRVTITSAALLRRFMLVVF